MPRKTVSNCSSAQPMNLFPTLGSTDEVVALANSKIPIGNKNEVYSLLMTYRNTLLKELQDIQREPSAPFSF